VTVWAVRKRYTEWSLCRPYHITMSLGFEALSHYIWKQYQSDGTPESISSDHLGGKPTTLAWQLFGRNLLRPHVPPFACSPWTWPKLETHYNTSHIRPDNLQPAHFFYDHRRTITITHRDIMCFLRRFLLGDRRRNHRIIYTSRSNTLLSVLLFLLFTVNLVLATCSFPFLFCFFGYPNALTYSLSPCSSRFFYTRGEVRSWRIRGRGRGFCAQDFVYLSEGIDFLLKTKNMPLLIPLFLCPEWGKGCWVENGD
jgi:hypothetical protein